MANWDTQLPDPAIEGAETHIEDHNTLVSALDELRSVVDSAQATIDTLQGLIDGKADGDHKHAAGDVTSGTLDAARIPTLAQSKVTGLASALESKADASALGDLTSRVQALEDAAQPEA